MHELDVRLVVAVSVLRRKESSLRENLFERVLKRLIKISFKIEMRETLKFCSMSNCISENNSRKYILLRKTMQPKESSVATLTEGVE